ncbi:hypothetical protein CCMA1212_004160 [Trichoderma ghanense]|uniref:Uncharacterized protein n=1 Tax=Trichoderma ghanense TaxID=65468 RepID=A0ABY2H7S6_9HYPO
MCPKTPKHQNTTKTITNPKTPSTHKTTKSSPLRTPIRLLDPKITPPPLRPPSAAPHRARLPIPLDPTALLAVGANRLCPVASAREHGRVLAAAVVVPSIENSPTCQQLPQKPRTKSDENQGQQLTAPPVLERRPLTTTRPLPAPHEHHIVGGRWLARKPVHFSALRVVAPVAWDMERRRRWLGFGRSEGEGEGVACGEEEEEEEEEDVDGRHGGWSSEFDAFLEGLCSVLSLMSYPSRVQAIFRIKGT